MVNKCSSETEVEFVSEDDSRRIRNASYKRIYREFTQEPALKFLEAFAAPVALKETETTNVIGTQRKKEHLIDVPQVLTSFYFYSPGSYRIENEVLADTSIPETFLKFPPLFANTIDQWLK